MRATSYVERETTPGGERLLALDGGGMRGALTLEVLEALEGLPREETGGRTCSATSSVAAWSAVRSTARLATCLELTRFGRHQGLRPCWPRARSIAVRSRLG
jgi:hypothetical protein